MGYPALNLNTHAIEIINVRGMNPAQLPSNAVYVGRPVGGWRGSPLGNPFTIDERHDRDFVIATYTLWLSRQMRQTTRAATEMERLRQLHLNGPLVLACWCAPLACHSEVIRKFIL